MKFMIAMTVPIAAITVGLAFVFVLGIMIFVHELGHFLMARRIGVRVLTFSLGFGPKLLKIHRGGTDYCLSALPLGGYVTLAGEKTSSVRPWASNNLLRVSGSRWPRMWLRAFRTPRATASNLPSVGLKTVKTLSASPMLRRWRMTPSVV